MKKTIRPIDTMTTEELYNAILNEMATYEKEWRTNNDTCDWANAMRFMDKAIRREFGKENI